VKSTFVGILENFFKKGVDFRFMSWYHYIIKQNTADKNGRKQEEQKHDEQLF